MKNDYNFWNVVTLVGSIICLIISIINLPQGNWLAFLISVVLILQLITMWKLNNLYAGKIKEIRRENTNVPLREDVNYIYIIEEKFELIKLETQRIIREIEQKNQQNLAQIKQVLLKNQRKISSLEESLNEDLQTLNQTLDEEPENLTDSLQELEIKPDFEQLINMSIDNKLLALQGRIEEQKDYLYYLISRSYQLGIRQTQELLIPIYEKQNYFEELQKIRTQQARIAIEQLKMDLSQVQQQQNQDYRHLTKLILEPMKPLAPHLGHTQNEAVVMDLENKINDLERMVDLAIRKYETNINNPDLSTDDFSANNAILPQSSYPQSSENHEVMLTSQQPSSWSNNIVPESQQNQQLEILNNIESVIQAEVENKSKEIDNIIENFSMQKQNLDHILEEKNRDYSENFESIYNNLNQINQLMISLENKYNSFTQVNNKVSQKFKRIIAKLYQQEVKPLKIQITDIVDGNKYLIRKQRELEEIYYAVSVELKTEINKLKDEIYTELGKMNDKITGV